MECHCNKQRTPDYIVGFLEVRQRRSIHFLIHLQSLFFKCFLKQFWHINDRLLPLMCHGIYVRYYYLSLVKCKVWLIKTCSTAPLMAKSSIFYKIRLLVIIIQLSCYLCVTKCWLDIMTSLVTNCGCNPHIKCWLM